MRKSLVAVVLIVVTVLLIVDTSSRVESNLISNRTASMVGKRVSTAAAIPALAISRTDFNSSAGSRVMGISVIDYANDPASVVTETSTLTSIYSYTVTSSSTSYTTTTTTTTATQTVVTTSTLPTTTTTTTTSTFWLTQTSTSTTWRTSTSMILLTSLTTITLTNTSTSFFPTVTVTSMNSSYKSTTAFSPTVTITFVQTSVVSTISTVTSVYAATTTITTTTVVVTRPCVIASAAYGSEIAPQVQSLRGFRDRTVMSTFAGVQFMRVFNAFYYSFSPIVAEGAVANPIMRSLVRAFISPLVATLCIASWVSGLLPLNSELATLFAGIVASGLIGVVYVTPFALFREVRRRTRRQGKNAARCVGS